MKKTPLYESHLQAKGKIVDFCGWALPIEYAGISAEHQAVRNRAGMFDVSHMGEYFVEGKDAEAFVQHLITNDITKIGDGRIQYSPMCYPNGGTVDDLLIYRFSPEKFLIVVNASNCEKDGEWFEKNRFGEIAIRNASDATAQLAIQGPKAQAVLQKLAAEDLAEIKFFRFRDDFELAGTKVLISRSGYTGEDGFEIYFDPTAAPKLWAAILEAGKDDGLEPAALGARDLLRFEACLPLYGQEIAETISPLTAGLDRFVNFDCGDFIGRDALLREKTDGSPRQLIAFEMKDRAVPRSHYPILAADGRKLGEVTHGTFSPGLQKSIGLGYVEPGALAVGDPLAIEIRGKTWPGSVVVKPFYNKQYKK